MEAVIPDYQSTSDAAGFGGAFVLVFLIPAREVGSPANKCARNVMVATSSLSLGKLEIFDCDNLSDAFAVLKGKSKMKEIKELCS